MTAPQQGHTAGNPISLDMEGWILRAGELELQRDMLFESLQWLVRWHDQLTASDIAGAKETLERCGK